MDNQGRAICTIAPESGYWPTKEQELLLRASLLEGSHAISAWEEWNSNVDMDLLDNYSRRLLPLLYCNMKAHGLDNSYVDMFKKIHQLTWFKNQMIFRSMTNLLQSFQGAGIKTMILKGAALVTLYYKDFGLRHMRDFDVLVPTEQLVPAIELVTKLGWRPYPEELLKTLKAFPMGQLFLKNRLEATFINEAGSILDLHHYVLPECCYEGADDDWWDAATMIELNGVRTHALNPTDTLLHICVHGTGWTFKGAMIHWVADAMMILNTDESEIDWNRLTSHAQKRRLLLPLRNALAYLRNKLDAPVPSTVLQSMQNMAVSRIEHLEYSLRSRPRGLTGGLPTNWFFFLRSSQLESGDSLRVNFIGFPTYLKHVWGLDSLWQLPLHTLSKGMKRIVKGNRHFTQPT